MTTSENRLVIGIDPGAGGAITAIYGGRAVIVDMPIKKEILKTKNKSGKFKMRSHLDSVRFVTIILSICETAANYFQTPEESLSTVVLLEKVHGMAGDGATQAFVFGEVCGSTIASLDIVAALLARGSFDIKDITPQKWKKALKIPSGRKMTKSEKNALVRQVVENTIIGKIKVSAIDSVGIALVAREAVSFFHKDDMITLFKVQEFSPPSRGEPKVE